MTDTRKNVKTTGWLRSRRVELIALLTVAVLVVIDQLTKLAIVANFSVGQTKAVIEGVLNLTYIRNDGAVFGSFSGKPYIFNTITVLVVAAGLFLLLSGKLNSNWLKWTAALVISGGIGNMIDRFRLKYVVDFIDVRCFGRFWTWVFNFADCCVVIGCMMLIAYFAADVIKDFKAQRAAKRPTDEGNTDAQS